MISEATKKIDWKLPYIFVHFFCTFLYFVSSPSDGGDGHYWSLLTDRLKFYLKIRAQRVESRAILLFSPHPSHVEVCCRVSWECSPEVGKIRCGNFSFS